MNLRLTDVPSKQEPVRERERKLAHLLVPLQMATAGQLVAVLRSAEWQEFLQDPEAPEHLPELAKVAVPLLLGWLAMQASRQMDVDLSEDFLQQLGVDELLRQALGGVASGD